MERLKIETGSKSYEIADESGNVLGVFTFVPSDTNLIPRYNEMINKLEAYAAQVENTVFTEETFVRVQDDVVDIVSAFVGEDMRDTFFSKIGAFTPTTSGLYVENVIMAIGAAIEKETRSRMKKLDKRLNQYLEGYKK